jgi:hypothetical protein
MSDDQVELEIRQQIRVVQIIAISLIIGVLTFGAIAYQLGNEEQRPPETPILAYFALGFGLQMLVVHLVVPTFVVKSQIKAIVKQTRRRNVRVSLVAVHRAKTIIRFALLEGAAFFALVCFMTTGHEYALGTALVMLFMMSVQFPGTNRVLNWIDMNAEVIEQQRNINDV